MDLKDYLTNEKIRKKFGNQFDLVNYAIKLAENMIISGRDPRVKTESQNRSLQVLAEILQGKDHLDDLLAIPPAAPAAPQILIIDEIDDDEDDEDDEDEVKEKPSKSKATAKKTKKTAAK